MQYLVALSVGIALLLFLVIRTRIVPGRRSHPSRSRPCPRSVPPPPRCSPKWYYDEMVPVTE